MLQKRSSVYRSGLAVRCPVRLVEGSIAYCRIHEEADLTKHGGTNSGFLKRAMEAKARARRLAWVLREGRRADDDLFTTDLSPGTKISP